MSCVLVFDRTQLKEEDPSSQFHLNLLYLDSTHHSNIIITYYGAHYKIKVYCYLFDFMFFVFKPPLYVGP